ncbi:MAG: hypothetical protein Q7T50_02610, partial [Candidatus Magasanikbacteria bacterium]|nr:hypothetical protein [Candidatus Magasanikbacteria bacterium]
KIPLFAVIVIAGPFVLLALALAFLPVNGQPFERAAAAFIKTIYSPNVRVWHKEPKTLGFLEPQFSIYLRSQSNSSGEPRILSDRTKINAYLKSHRQEKNKKMVDINEDRRLKQLQFSPLAQEKEVFVAPNLANLGPDLDFNKASEKLRFQRNDKEPPELKEKMEARS